MCFCSPFPTVAEAVQEELEDYKTKEDEVRRLKRAMVIDFTSLIVKLYFWLNCVLIKKGSQLKLLLKKSHITDGNVIVQAIGQYTGVMVMGVFKLQITPVTVTFLLVLN